MVGGWRFEEGEVREDEVLFWRLNVVRRSGETLARKTVRSHMSCVLAPKRKRVPALAGSTGQLTMNCLRAIRSMAANAGLLKRPNMTSYMCGYKLFCICYGKLLNSIFASISESIK